ncbi:MAG: hypothetical protein LCI02_14025 [Proteobacteria bacterium]|nr:hypothetical protein [Pseudomonadota bacterium]
MLDVTLRLQPGRAAGASIERPPRPDLAALLAVGRPAAELPALMAGLHALCAHGHRAAAALALRAARGEPLRWSDEDRVALQHAVAREHLLRIAHDWPRLLPAVPAPAHSGAPVLAPALAPALVHPGAPSLQDCPLWQPALGAAQQLRALPGWLQQRWLHGPLPALCDALAADPAAAALAWARRTPGAPAAWLAALLPRALALRTAHRPLREQVAPPATIVPDTGPWNRHHDTAAPPADNAGMRLIARLHELLLLARPEGQQRLQVHAATAAGGVGTAWVEVGRGRLSYRVQIGGDERVQRLQVLSPTDWNFHPAGVLAEALAEVDDADDARILAVAFDPCEPFEVRLPQRQAEAEHA